VNRTYSGVRGSPRQPRLAGQSTRLPPGVLCFLSFFYQFATSFPSAVRWLCKLFDKALVGVLARGALAMCLQIGLAIPYLIWILVY